MLSLGVRLGILWGFIWMAGCAGVPVKGVGENPVLGPQSQMAKGELRVLMAVVRFPDVEPTFPLERIQKKVVVDLDRYVKEQSYGQAWLKADFRGWVRLPDPISSYKISPYNFQVDRSRVRKLVEDTMTALEKDVDFSQYQHILIVPGAQTTPGKGYGMICYCANPGMLTGTRRNPEYVTLKSKNGKQFQGGVFVGTENANLGMFAHDFFHALGGIYARQRLVPCLYDYELQSDASRSPLPEHHAVYMGAWDIMSEHFVKRDQPPPGISSFTKIRLGWISPEKVMVVKPGESAYAFLSPLAQGGSSLVVKIPLPGGLYYLAESRQPVGFDEILPDSGLLILKVNPEAKEGSGTVQVMNASPGAPRFTQAAYRLDGAGRNLFLDKKNNLAVIPLWAEGDKLGVLVTSAEKGPRALDAASRIQKLLARFLEPRTREKDQVIRESLEAFKRFDFQEAAQRAQRGLE
jgi:M6 family metalloprotease-like protein